jgi:hypothetical protein
MQQSSRTMLARLLQLYAQLPDDLDRCSRVDDQSLTIRPITAIKNAEKFLSPKGVAVRRKPLTQTRLTPQYCFD